MENWEVVGLILRDYMEWYSRERGNLHLLQYGFPQIRTVPVPSISCTYILIKLQDILLMQLQTKIFFYPFP